MKLKAIVITTITVSLLSCGFKGPLVLPKQSPQNATPNSNQFAPTNFNSESASSESKPAIESATSNSIALN